MLTFLDIHVTNLVLRAPGCLCNWFVWYVKRELFIVSSWNFHIMSRTNEWQGYVHFICFSSELLTSSEKYTNFWDNLRMSLAVHSNYLLTSDCQRIWRLLLTEVCHCLLNLLCVQKGTGRSWGFLRLSDYRNYLLHGSYSVLRFRVMSILSNTI